MSEKVEGITLKGFKYPLLKYTMTNDDGIGISNEIQEDTAYVEFESGILLMIMSRWDIFRNVGKTFFLLKIRD